jgi:VWFA-related protein
MPAEAHMTLLPFSNTVSTPRSFTSDKFELGRRIGALPTPNGETALFDATLTAVETLEAARPKGRRAVVVLTDGIDNTSRRRVEEVIDRARETRTTLHLVGLGQPGDLDEKTMREMAEKTGGKYYPARNAADLQLHFRDVAEELGATYTVTFPSRRPIHDGTSRGIDISVVRGGKAVSARASYDYQVHGVVVAQMHPGVYLGLLALLGVLLALPMGMRRLYRFYGGA